MAVQFAPWQPATHCTHGAGAGAKALMAAILATDSALKNWGIFNCRNTALGNRSAHGEGRALDVGCGLKAGARLVKLLRTIGPSRLGICAIIHNRVIYSAKSPNGRRYTGVPHTDHVHIELTRSAASKLTLATVRRVLSGGAAATKAPTPKAGSRTLRKGSKGADVKTLQKKLDLNADGVFGERTEAAVRSYQHRHGLKVDGVVGKATWKELLS